MDNLRPPLGFMFTTDMDNVYNLFLKRWDDLEEEIQRTDGVMKLALLVRQAEIVKLFSILWYDSTQRLTNG